MYENVEDFETDLSGEKEIIFDGVENRTNRPKNADNQKDMYSGKKSAHTNAAMVLSNKDRWIYYVSYLYIGSCHDFGIFTSEFEPGLGWFKKFKVILDLGFIGFKKLYDSKEVLIGFKKQRKSKNNPNPPDLTKAQKQWNRFVSKQRIYVEHAIGGMKRYRVLVNTNRLKCYKLKNTILGICAGLWNFKLSINR
ncbi:MAG: transposase family protein [Bacteroidota bacterium]